MPNPNGKQAPAAAVEDEIGAPQISNGNDGPVAPNTFTSRLRQAVENLKDGEYLDIRTSAERQTVSNLVGTIAKKTGIQHQTTVLRKRGDDAEGKIALRIKRTGQPFVPAKGAKAGAASTEQAAQS